MRNNFDDGETVLCIEDAGSLWAIESVSMVWAQSLELFCKDGVPLSQQVF